MHGTYRETHHTHADIYNNHKRTHTETNTGKHRHAPPKQPQADTHTHTAQRYTEPHMTR